MAEDGKSPAPDGRTLAQERGLAITHLKSALTRFDIILEAHKRTEDKFEIINSKTNDIIRQYENFSTLNEKFLNENAGNQDVINQALEIETLFSITLKKSNAICHPETSSQSPSPSSSNVHFVHSITTAPQIFSGNPNDFLSWLETFKVYCNHVSTYDERIILLKRFTEGDALNAIEHLTFRPKNKSTFDEAIKILKDNFGSDDIVSDSIISKLENFPKIAPHDGRALNSFHNLLVQALSLSESCPSLNILNERIQNKRLMWKLSLRLIFSFLISERKNQ